MINGVDIVFTMFIFAMGFILGALFCFIMRMMVKDDEEREDEQNVE